MHKLIQTARARIHPPGPSNQTQASGSLGEGKLSAAPDHSGLRWIMAVMTCLRGRSESGYSF